MNRRIDVSIILCDQNEEVVRSWEDAFAGCPSVTVRCGDFFDIPADAYISPANSYGIMDGGFDLALRDYFGYAVQERLQDAILALGGILPVGEAVIVETDDPEVPYLIAAPTMETPSNVAYTNNAFDAMQAILAAVTQFNEEQPDAIEVIAIPGLCTGIGGMDPDVSASQMRAAYDQTMNLTQEGNPFPDGRRGIPSPMVGGVGHSMRSQRK